MSLLFAFASVLATCAIINETAISCSHVSHTLKRTICEYWMILCLFAGTDRIRHTTNVYDFSGVVDDNYTPSPNAENKRLELQFRTLDAPLWKQEVCTYLLFFY